MDTSFLLKDALKPVFSEITNSTTFNTVYDASFGLRVSFDEDGYTLISLHPDEEALFANIDVLLETNEDTEFNAIKSTIFEAIKNKPLYTINPSSVYGNVDDEKRELDVNTLEELFSSTVDIVLTSNKDGGDSQVIILYFQDDFKYEDFYIKVKMR